MVTRAKNKENLETTSLPRPVVWFQNNFTEMFLLFHFTKIAKTVPTWLNKLAPRAKNRGENFPCWCFTESLCFTGFSFPAGASNGLFHLLVLHKFPTKKFCHGNQTKWPPLIDISQAMTPSLPQAVLSSSERSRAIWPSYFFFFFFFLP